MKLAILSLGMWITPVLAQAATDPCVTKTFKTEFYKDACSKGGQPAAKNAAKTWMKEKKVKDCKQCHAKLEPKFELKSDAVDQFKKLGGK